jgi:hypothetical protein
MMEAKTLSEAQMKKASAILVFDLYKNGSIRQFECLSHGRTNLTYDYENGQVVVRCRICGVNQKWSV